MVDTYTAANGTAFTDGDIERWGGEAAQERHTTVSQLVRQLIDTL